MAEHSAVMMVVQKAELRAVKLADRMERRKVVMRVDLKVVYLALHWAAW